MKRIEKVNKHENEVTHKSLKINMMLNSIRGICGIIFPIITFPYITRVLGVEVLGGYSFTASIISYIQLLAGLGISTYAIREGAKIREDTRELSRFANEVFSINLLSTFAAYAALALLMFFVPKFGEYKALLIILSLQVIFKTVGIDWLYSIYESYAYITIRSLVFQVLSLIMLFLFVKNKQDVLIYAGITVAASAGSNVFNYLHAKSYCNVRITRHINFRKHIKPIMVLFTTTVTVTIYVSSDTTILGFLCDNSTVGIYSASVKIYSMLKTVLASALVVSIPRLSSEVGKQDINSFSNSANDIYATLLTMLLPVITGILLLRNEIIQMFAGVEYMEAASSLSILTLAMLFCMEAYFWGQCILIPHNAESVVLKITVVSAIINIVLNILLIPRYKENAAAFTTLISEFVAFVYCRWKAKELFKPRDIYKDVLKIGFGCGLICLVVCLLKPLKYLPIPFFITAIALSILVYFASQLLLRNRAISSIAQLIKGKSTREE